MAAHVLGIGMGHVEGARCQAEAVGAGGRQGGAQARAAWVGGSDVDMEGGSRGAEVEGAGGGATWPHLQQGGDEMEGWGGEVSDVEMGGVCDRQEAAGTGGRQSGSRKLDSLDSVRVWNSVWWLAEACCALQTAREGGAGDWSSMAACACGISFQGAERAGIG